MWSMPGGCGSPGRGIHAVSPGGWVKFTGRSNSGDEKDLYTMELIAKGTGAKSELGVIK